MTPNCDTYRDDLIAYRDGELPPLRRWLVRWHLAHCAACREELMIMEQISEKIRSSESETLGPTATLDPALRHKILSSVATAPDTGTAPLTDNKIEQADRDSTATVTPRARPSVLWREWAAIGACVLFFGVAFVTMRGTRLKGGFSTAASAINTSTGGADESAPDTFRSPVAAGGAGIHYNGGLTERDTTPSSGAGGAASSSDNFAPGAIKTTPSSSTSSAAAPSAHRSLAKGEVLYADGRVRWNRNVTGSPTIPPGAFSTDNMPSSL
ncbi:MAG: zf-HC2 domain-containing protein, partial [Abitibacteriaceae bacterium]|nr:zf-HC2 domain-containing protein [Abditibacteriaceae bacterium]